MSYESCIGRALITATNGHVPILASVSRMNAAYRLGVFATTPATRAEVERIVRDIAGVTVLSLDTTDAAKKDYVWSICDGVVLAAPKLDMTAASCLATALNALLYSCLSRLIVVTEDQDAVRTFVRLGDAVDHEALERHEHMGTFVLTESLADLPEMLR